MDFRCAYGCNGGEPVVLSIYWHSRSTVGISGTAGDGDRESDELGLTLGPPPSNSALLTGREISMLIGEFSSGAF